MKSAHHHTPSAPGRRSGSLQRVMKLPVTIAVRLAEKKIELGQLLALNPGALITFNKPCEDLPDLYINNRIYCRGEAVKIGEKFGLKINELNVTEPLDEPTQTAC
jgi:flagellar motor switch protein FliN/FliY